MLNKEVKLEQGHLIRLLPKIACVKIHQNM